MAKSKRYQTEESRIKKRESDKRHYEKCKEQISNRRKKQYQEDPDFKARALNRAYNRQQRIKNDPEEIKKHRERNKKRYDNLSSEEIAKLRSRQKEWLEQNSEKREIYKLNKNAARRERYAKQMTKAVKLLGGKCKVCGLVDHPIIYDFHHREPDKKEYALCRIFGEKKWEDIKKELEKCDLLCSHCHRKLTCGII